MLASRFVRTLGRANLLQPQLLRPFTSKFVSADLGETEYEEMKTVIRKPDAIPSWYFKFDDNKYHILKTISDNRYLLMKGMLMPRYAGSAYYSLERNGIIYHVFNAERMVFLPYEGLWPHLQCDCQVLSGKRQAGVQERSI